MMMHPLSQWRELQYAWRKAAEDLKRCISAQGHVDDPLRSLEFVRKFEGILPDLVLIGMARPAAVAICMSGSEAMYKKAMERQGSLPKWMCQWGLIPGRPDHPEDDFLERWRNAARDA